MKSLYLRVKEEIKHIDQSTVFFSTESAYLSVIAKMMLGLNKDKLKKINIEADD